MSPKHFTQTCKLTLYERFTSCFRIETVFKEMSYVTVNVIFLLFKLELFVCDVDKCERSFVKVNVNYYKDSFVVFV